MRNLSVNTEVKEHIEIADDLDRTLRNLFGISEMVESDLRSGDIPDPDGFHDVFRNLIGELAVLSMRVRRLNLTTVVATEVSSSEES